MRWQTEQQKGLHPLLSAHLDKHFAHGAVFGGAVNGHGLPVSGELQGEVLLHQLLDDLMGQTEGRGEKGKPADCRRVGGGCRSPSCRRSPDRSLTGCRRRCRRRSFSPRGRSAPSRWPRPPSRTRLSPERVRNTQNLPSNLVYSSIFYAKRLDFNIELRTSIITRLVN